VSQDETSFTCLAFSQQELGALREACGNEPRPAPAFAQRLGLTEQQNRELTFLSMPGDDCAKASIWEMSAHYVDAAGAGRHHAHDVLPRGGGMFPILDGRCTGHPSRGDETTGLAPRSAF
jgi:hypothetical protein